VTDLRQFKIQFKIQLKIHYEKIKCSFKLWNDLQASGSQSLSVWLGYVALMECWVYLNGGLKRTGKPVGAFLSQSKGRDTP